jgi:hypothetical protein
MSQYLAVASAPIADTGPGSTGNPGTFNVLETILSQYANSPVLLAILQAFSAANDRAANVQAFYDQMWNVETAVGYGLDVWGRIVGVTRVLQVPVGGFLGFNEATDALTFGFGIWGGRGTLTSNYALSDVAFRRLVLAKAALNITDGSIPHINATIIALFPNHGNCYIRDNLDMTSTFVFGSTLSALELAIVTQSGVLPKAAGVLISAEYS